MLALHVPSCMLDSLGQCWGGRQNSQDMTGLGGEEGWCSYFPLKCMAVKGAGRKISLEHSKKVCNILGFH